MSDQESNGLTAGENPLRQCPNVCLEAEPEAGGRTAEGRERNPLRMT